jgi:hypothetical protein
VSVQNRTGLTSQAPPPVQRRLGLALLVIATAELMLVLDDTIVNVALPSMQRSLHLATSHLNWVISFYALAFGGLMLAGGRAGDLFGRLKVFRLGIAVFTLASLAGGFAPNGPALIASRVVQGGALRVVPAGHHVPGRAGQDQGARRLRRDGRPRLGGRPAARRRAHRVPELALGAVHQRAHRGRGADRHRRPRPG